MNRTQLADEVAELAAEDFDVMRPVVLVYDTDTEQFCTQSHLTPRADTEMVLDWDIQADHFIGGHNDDVTEDELRDYIRENDGYWQEIKDLIGQGGADRW